MKGKAKLDRIADPTLSSHAADAGETISSRSATCSRDLAGRPGNTGGVVGAQAIEALVARARAGKFDSAATFAALLATRGRERRTVHFTAQMPRQIVANRTARSILPPVIMTTTR